MISSLRLKGLRGFTLIELLIVIAIIAILTIAFLPTLRGGQSRARDAARKSLIVDLSSALEGYINSGAGNAPADAAGAANGVAQGQGICIDTDNAAYWAPASVPGGSAVGMFSNLLGRVPAGDLRVDTLTSLCGAGGLYYNQTATTGVNDFILALQVENAQNANVDAAGTVVDVAAADNITAVLGLQDGAMPTACTTLAPCIFVLSRFEN